MKPHCHLYAIDFRGHGESQTAEDSNLSSERLVQDINNIIAALKLDNIILIGHSLGGAIAVQVSATISDRIKGIMVIDVVEGTALSALSHMSSFLKNRPSRFTSEEEAIEWSIQSKTVRNLESARVSIPSQLNSVHDLKWRTDLLNSEKYWKGWFTGLSDMFLDLKAHKVLVLAGTDRLDTSLTRGQMQGKFQLLLLYGCGHVIQEDEPEKTADAILSFCSRITTVPGRGTSTQDTLAEKLARARGMRPPC